MDIHEISERFKVNIRTLQRLHAGGVLLVTESENPLASRIRHGLAKGNPLSVSMLVALLSDETLLTALGKYETRATVQIKRLGDVHNELASAEITTRVEGASMGNAQDIAALVEWMKATIARAPGSEVSHAYLAVRLVLGTKESFRELIASRISFAFIACRAAPEFAGWFTVRTVRGQPLTIYHQPTNYPLDL